MIEIFGFFGFVICDIIIDEKSFGINSVILYGVVKDIVFLVVGWKFWVDLKKII